MTNPAYVVMPDAVAMARSVLAADPDVADVVAERIGTMSPEDTSTPWIRLHEIGGPRSLSAPQRLATRSVQVDLFVPASAPGLEVLNGDAGAMTLALLAEAALFAASGTSIVGIGVLVKVTEFARPAVATRHVP